MSTEQQHLLAVQTELRGITGTPVKDEADRLRRVTLWRELDRLVGTGSPR
jgi:hypothetical protein